MNFFKTFLEMRCYWHNSICTLKILVLAKLDVFKVTSHQIKQF